MLSHTSPDQSWNLSPEGQLAVDVGETSDRIFIRSAIAGVTDKDLTINVTPDLITIRGARAPLNWPENTTVHYEECFWGNFSRSVLLPSSINPESANAELKNGVLLITAQKARNHFSVPIKTH